jgi:hypothetical protein
LTPRISKTLWSFAAFCGLLLSGFNLHGQHQDVHEKPALWRGHQHMHHDSEALVNFFKAGQFHGHFRSFFSATDNSEGLSDYHALAAGGGIRFESKAWKGFQFGVSGFFIFHVFSSDLAKPDPLTGQGNRYEVGLFNQEEPGNRHHIDRLEEFFLKYNRGKSHITFGKQLINTPFINLQDGRMRPTGVDGIWGELHPNKKLRLEGGWIYAISPRGTVEWYHGGKSIGVYPTGLNPDGTPSRYAGNVHSDGVAMLGLDYRPSKSVNIQQWNMMIEGVSYSGMMQANYQQALSRDRSWGISLQSIAQTAIGDGGNTDQSKAYMLRGARSFTFGARGLYRHRAWEHSLNYNRITAQGRYLVPREWGRDPFFTFMPRERNDGLGDVHAIVARTQWSPGNKPYKINLAGGYFKVPDVRNTALNKYGMPSYAQANLDLRYKFKHGLLQGLEAQALVVAKKNIGETYENPRFIFNKTDMVLYNVILNYHF